MIDRILVIDDESLIRELMQDTISRHGIDVTLASSGEEGIAALRQQEFQMCFSDMRMGELTGLDVLKFAREHCPNMVFVIMTAYGSIETAVEAMRMGAFDFIIKPFTPDQTDVLVEKAKQWLSLSEQNEYLRQEVSPVKRRGKSRIIGQSAELQKIQLLIQRVAPTGATVLVTGESGTGKELIAGEIHRLSDPKGVRPYIRMNCAAVPETLLESELFGHEKGSFTGASERRVGRFELADGGTLLLDEIGEINVAMQAKLLRVLQESEFERVGGAKTIKVNVRVVATTNRNLKKEVEAGNFREDLYYRLNVFPIHLPSLRERADDIPLIAEEFLSRQTQRLGRELKFAQDAMDCMRQYPWPGNIREMENVVERVAILEDGPVIPAAALPPEIRSRAGASPAGDLDTSRIFNIGEIERRTVMRALQETNGNRTRAADLLGFNVRTLRNKLNEYRAAGTWTDDAGGSVEGE